MAKVYTGKVVIPGDRIEEYIELLRAAEKETAPFREKFLALHGEFYDHLCEKYSECTARKHAGIIEMFIQFICRYTDVRDISEITRGMVNTHFQEWWRRKVWDSSKPNDRRVALKKFFRFLAAEKKIVNEKALKALE